MPTTFSTALPAMATMTRPANVGEMCTASLAGERPATNQSDTNAALTPATASSPRASARGHCSTFAVCAVAGVSAAFVSDWFVAGLTPPLDAVHISPTSAGLVIVAIAGNAVENVVGIQLALRNQADYALSV